MDFKEFYSVDELLNNEIKDFRHIELFTRDLVNKDYDHMGIISKISNNKQAMQKLGFICEVAKEYANLSFKNNKNLNKLYRTLDTWRKHVSLEKNVTLNESNSSFMGLLKEYTNPKAEKWNIASDYSSGDFVKLHKIY